jgi:very-short-patch-repair endonuclease
MSDKAYNRTPTLRSRELRTHSTPAEQAIWRFIRNRQVAQTRFNRQVPIGPYICDFVARSAKVIIELDGGQHAVRTSVDASRTEFLENRGYRVLRFWNNDVLDNLDGVLAVIEEAVSNMPSPGPSRDAGGEL